MMKGGSLYFPHRVTCKSAAQLLEDLAVHLAKHDGGLDLTAIQLRQGVEGTAAVLVVLRQHGQRYQHLIGVQTRVVAMEHRGLHALDRHNHILRNQLEGVVDAGQVLRGIEQ